MSHWWVADLWKVSPVLLASWVLWTIGSICLHELSHGWAAIREGDRTPIWSGHMTWNPMVHMGTNALLMFALFGFTWGLMPVSPSNFRSRYGQAYVSFAGPAMNLSLAIACVVLWATWDRWAPNFFAANVVHNGDLFFRCGTAVNFMGFLFNLIPIPPLDGSWILGDFYPRYWSFFGSEKGQFVGFIAFGLLFFTGGTMVWGLAFKLSYAALHVASMVLGGSATTP